MHPSADVSEFAELGEDCVIWHHAQIREGAKVGAESTVGKGAYVGVGVELGARCKIQNYALIYEPARIGTGVFVGPGAVLTNDAHPRAISTNGFLKSATDWEPEGVTVGHGASIGANATCIAPLAIGEWAVVAAGAVVTADVKPFALVAGVPARQIAWVGHAGKRLKFDGEHFICPETQREYLERGGRLKVIESNE